MNNHQIRQTISLFFMFFVVSVLILSSCVPLKKVMYVQNKDEKDTLNAFILKQRPKNTVQPFDNLYINIISPDETTSRMFNSQAGGGGSSGGRNVDII